MPQEAGMAEAQDPILVIDLWVPWTTCHRCGTETPVKWGLPVGEGGEVVPDWWEGWWGGVPACKACYEAHAAWSDRLHRPFEAPLV